MKSEVRRSAVIGVSQSGLT